MSTATQTPGDRACRYATSAETVMRAYATEAMGDLASGLEMLAQEAAAALIVAVDGESMDALEEASCAAARPTPSSARSLTNRTTICFWPLKR